MAWELQVCHIPAYLDVPEYPVHSVEQVDSLVPSSLSVEQVDSQYPVHSVEQVDSLVPSSLSVEQVDSQYPVHSLLSRLTLSTQFTLC